MLPAVVRLYNTHTFLAILNIFLAPEVPRNANNFCMQQYSKCIYLVYILRENNLRLDEGKRLRCPGSVKDRPLVSRVVVAVVAEAWVRDVPRGSGSRGGRGHEKGSSEEEGETLVECWSLSSILLPSPYRPSVVKRLQGWGVRGTGSLLGLQGVHFVTAHTHLFALCC